MSSSFYMGYNYSFLTVSLWTSCASCFCFIRSIVATLASSTHSLYASPSFSLVCTTPFKISLMKLTKLCLRSAVSHCHMIRFCSSRFSHSWSPISLALSLKSRIIAIKLNRISWVGYRSIRRWRTGMTLTGNSSKVQAPCEMGAGWRPSSS